MSSVPELLMNLDMTKLRERFNKLPENVRNEEANSNPLIYTDKTQMVDLLTRQQKVENINRGTFTNKIGKHLNNAHTKQAFNGKDIIVTLDLKSDKAKSIRNIGKYPLTEDAAKDDVDRIIRESFQYFKNIKLRMRKEIFYKVYHDVRTTWSSTKQTVVSSSDYDIDSLFERLTSISRIDGSENSSNVVYLAIKSVQVEIHNYQPLAGSSFIELPDRIKNKKACINIQNDDKKCFLWSVIAGLYPAAKNVHRLTTYKKHEDVFNMQNIEYPVKVRDIDRFERQNPVSINVFALDDNNKVYPLRITKSKENKLVNLLLISNAANQHYVLIKNFSRLMSDYNKNACKKHFCMYCLHAYSSERLLLEHNNNCGEVQKISYPESGSKLEFKNHRHKLPVPFVIYCDFESILKNSDGVLHEHECCGFAYKVVCKDDPRRTKQTVVYRGEDAAYKFLQAMIKERSKIIEILKTTNVPMKLSGNELDNFKQAKICHICEKKLTKGQAVKDHCHFTGKYRGAAHSRCNLDYNNINNNKLFIPVVFHNLKGYDSHFIIKELHRFEINPRDRMDISVIPNNMERFISFSLFTRNKLRFIDSFAFMASSLAKLTANLEPDDFSYINDEFDNDISLLTKKGIYPYEYMNSFDKFTKTRLPKQEKFYSKLTDSNITDEEYEHAQMVFVKYECKHLGDYHDLYLKTDVLLLTCVFEKFRAVCLENYELDCLHYYTSPGLSWDAMLRMTGVKLDLITDPDMFLFFEKGIRGGISTITHRYAKANNKYLSNYNNTKRSTYISYLDANNLYGWSMSQNLPIDGFKWSSEDEYYKCKDTDGIGFALEVNLEYPKDLHQLHNDYPLAPERVKVDKSMLSDYNLQFNNKSFTEKLIPNLYDKKKYILHYKNLELYLSLGLKLTRIHRVIQFNESKWLAKYISFNTEKRKKAQNAFEKDFYKLMNNSVFGKTMENLRKRTKVELTTEEIRRNKLVNKPNFKRMEIYRENYVGVELGVTTIKMEKPIYCGFSILDLSKYLMYDFHYNVIKKDFPSGQSKLLMTDTDSLCYELETGDLYEYYKRNKNYFDLSEFSRRDIFDGSNKKVIGKFKDESPNKQIIKFCGLRSKMYAMVYEDANETKKCKGVKKSVVTKDINFNDYKKVLKTTKKNMVSIVNIRSKSHNVNTVEESKVCLSAYDDKRYLLNDGIKSYAYGNISY